MRGDGWAGRLRVGLVAVLLVAGCGAGGTTSTPTTSPAPSAVATPAATPTSAIATPGAASFDPAFASSLETALERLVKVLQYPAISAAVILPDGTSWSSAVGTSDLAAGKAATPDTSFVVGSVTKTFIAALALELAHDGVLSLEDRLVKWLPKLAGDPRFAAERVTVRQLLDHTSGIPDYTADDGFRVDVLKDPSRRWTPAEVLGWVRNPAAEPGTAFEYSNTNYILAGMVIESATGSTVASLVRQRFLVPLGLDHTSLQPQEPPVAPTAHAYSEALPGGWAGNPVDPWDGSGLTPSASFASAVWTAGGVTGTASDLARWAAALYGGRVLDPASLSDMLDVGRNARLLNGGGYGLGVATGDSADKPAVGHSGGVPGFQCEMWYLTKLRVAIVVLANTDSPSFTDAFLALQSIVVQHVGT